PSHGRRIAVTGARTRILRLCDGRRTVEEIVAAVGLDLEVVAQQVRRLTAARVLITGLEVPSTIFHPLSHLRGLVEAMPPAWDRRGWWAAELRRMDELRVAFR